jgi:hypothetical protein
MTTAGTIPTPTPAPAADVHADSRDKLNELIAVLSAEAVEESDPETIASLAAIVHATAALTKAEADHLHAVNARHAAERA